MTSDAIGNCIVCGAKVLTSRGCDACADRVQRKLDRLAAIERRIENLIDRKKLHADRLREEGKGEHCEGFIDALDDEVDDLIAILDPPT